MDIIKNFGIDPIILSAQIINFLIILYILKRFFYRKILDALENRKNIISEGHKKAEESRLILEKANASEKEILNQAQEVSKKLLEETRQQRDQILLEAEMSAKKHAEKILEDAKAQIISETREAQKALSMQISRLAIEFLQKSAMQIFSKDDQDKLVNNIITKLKRRAD